MVRGPRSTTPRRRRTRGEELRAGGGSAKWEGIFEGIVYRHTFDDHLRRLNEAGPGLARLAFAGRGRRLLHRQAPAPAPPSWARRARAARTVRGGRRTLRNHAPAADAGRPLDDGDAAGDALLPEPSRRLGARAASGRPRRSRRSPRTSTVAGTTSASSRTSSQARFEAIPRFNTADALRAFYELYAEKQGKERWGDKTPDYIKRMRQIKRVLPEARFIHVIRDGRDVTLSTNKRIVERGHRDPLPAKRSARRWRNRIEKARADGPKLGEYLEIRYEDLVDRHRADAQARLRVHRARVRAGDAPLPRDGLRAPVRDGRSDARAATGAPSARRASGSRPTRSPPSRPPRSGSRSGART